MLSSQMSIEKQTNRWTPPLPRTERFRRDRASCASRVGEASVSAADGAVPAQSDDISKHLKVIEKAGLDRGRGDGQRRPRRLAPLAMKDIATGFETVRSSGTGASKMGRPISPHLKSGDLTWPGPTQASHQTNSTRSRRHTIRLTCVFEPVRRRSSRRGRGPEHVSCWWECAGGALRHARSSTCGPGGPLSIVSEGPPGHALHPAPTRESRRRPIVFEASRHGGYPADVAGQTTWRWWRIDASSASSWSHYQRWASLCGTSQTLDNSSRLGAGAAGGFDRIIADLPSIVSLLVCHTEGSQRDFGSSSLSRAPDATITKGRPFEALSVMGESWSAWEARRAFFLVRRRHGEAPGDGPQ